MKGQPLITLSIVSHGDADKIGHLLASLQKHEPDTGRFEIILTDNLGNNLPQFDPGPWESIRTIRSEQQGGFAYNHNRAFEAAKGEYFAILNPDLIFENPVFDELLTSLQTHHADLIAPQIIDTNGIIQDSARSLPTPNELIRRRMPDYDSEGQELDANGFIHPDWIAAMFWLMGSDVYRQLGGMDERYRLYFEDVDFCTRARLKGMKIVVDTKAQVQHDAQRSSRKKLYYLFLHIQSAVRFFTSNVYHQARRR
jgi:GT2 family glycosyltransferase